METPPPIPYGQAPSTDSRNLAMLCHLLAIFTGFLAPLIIWLVKKDQDAFVNDQGKEALNFQLTALIVALGCFIALCAAPVLILVVQVLRIIFCILATIEASRGKAYRYPICIRLVK